MHMHGKALISCIVETRTRCTSIFFPDTIRPRKACTPLGTLQRCARAERTPAATAAPSQVPDLSSHLRCQQPRMELAHVAAGDLVQDAHVVVSPEMPVSRNGSSSPVLYVCHMVQNSWVLPERRRCTLAHMPQAVLERTSSASCCHQLHAGSLHISPRPPTILLRRGSRRTARGVLASC